MTEQTPQAPRRSNWVLIATGIVGAVVLLGGIGIAAASGVATAVDRTPETQTMTADASGIRELAIEVKSSNVLVLFDGLAGPGTVRLDVEGGRDQWQLRRDGDTLVAESHRAFPLDWFTFGPWNEQRVVLRLPSELRGKVLDAHLHVSSGSLALDAALGEVQATVSSGSLALEGSARSLDARLSSGSMRVDLADVGQASLGVSSGQLYGELTGTAPKQFEVRVSSGQADITLPDQAYDVTSTVSSGHLENLLRTDRSSRHLVDVRISSGSVTLQPGR